MFKKAEMVSKITAYTKLGESLIKDLDLISKGVNDKSINVVNWQITGRDPIVKRFRENIIFICKDLEIDPVKFFESLLSDKIFVRIKRNPEDDSVYVYIDGKNGTYRIFLY